MAAASCVAVTESTSGTNSNTTTPCSIPMAAAAVARPVSTAVTPAGLASMRRSIPNSRSYTVEIEVSMAPKRAAITTSPGKTNA
jgi:hypothetical protein